MCCQALKVSDSIAVFSGVANDHQRTTNDQFKWAGNQEAVTFLGYRPIRS